MDGEGQDVTRPDSWPGFQDLALFIRTWPCDTMAWRPRSVSSRGGRTTAICRCAGAARSRHFLAAVGLECAQNGEGRIGIDRLFGPALRPGWPLRLWRLRLAVRFRLSMFSGLRSRPLPALALLRPGILLLARRAGKDRCPSATRHRSRFPPGRGARACGRRSRLNALWRRQAFRFGGWLSSHRRLGSFRRCSGTFDRRVRLRRRNLLRGRRLRRFFDNGRSLDRSGRFRQ